MTTKHFCSFPLQINSTEASSDTFSSTVDEISTFAAGVHNSCKRSAMLRVVCEQSNNLKFARNPSVPKVKNATRWVSRFDCIVTHLKLMSLYRKSKICEDSKGAISDDVLYLGFESDAKSLLAAMEPMHSLMILLQKTAMNLKEGLEATDYMHEVLAKERRSENNPLCLLNLHLFTLHHIHKVRLM